MYIRLPFTDVFKAPFLQLAPLVPRSENVLMSGATLVGRDFSTAKASKSMRVFRVLRAFGVK